MSLPRLLRLALISVLAALLVASPAGAAESDLLPLPTETRAGGLVAGPDGAMWFRGHHGPRYEGGEGNYIGRVIGNWQVTEFPLPKGAGAGAPIDGPEGDLWFPSRPAKGHRFGVTRMATSGQMHEYTLSTGLGEIGEIAANGSDLWVTMTHFKKHRNGVRNSVLARYSVSPTGLAPAQQITFKKPCYASALAAGAGTVWFAELCEPRNPSHPHWAARIIRVDPSGETAHYRLQYKSFVVALAVDSSGAVWFGNFRENGTKMEFGRIAPNGELARWSVPHGEPYSITVGAEGRLWFAIEDPDEGVRHLQSIGPAGDLGTPICVGPECEYTPYSLTTGPEGELWYSVEHAHTPYGGGGGGALMQEQEIAEESGFLGRLTP
jgi:streptogramin lyase